MESLTYVLSYLSIRLTRSEVLPTRKLIRKSVLRVFIGGWRPRHPLPNTSQNSRILEGKQVCINHIVQPRLCESLISVEELFTMQVFRCQPRAKLEASPLKESSLRLAMLTVFDYCFFLRSYVLILLNILRFWYVFGNWLSKSTYFCLYWNFL